MNTFAIATLATTAVALLIVIISMATDYWLSYSALGYTAHQGLWKGCGLGGCVDIGNSNLPDWFKGVRAAICLAFICNLVALVVVALRTFTSFVSPKILWIVGLAALGLSVFWTFIAVVVYGAETEKNLSWSWGIAILAIILHIVSIVLFFLTKRSEDQQ